MIEFVLIKCILKEQFLGVPKSEQPECTLVLEDCEDEGNEKSAL